MNLKLIIPGILLASSVLFFPSFTSEDDINKTGIDLTALNKDVSPAHDFYQFANGNWIKNNPVPKEEARWGSFDVLREENNKKIRTVIEEVAADKSAPKGSVRQQLRDFYTSAMDSVTIEKQDISLIKPLLDRISNIKDKPDMLAAIGELHKKGIGNTFGMYVHRDLKKSDEHIMYFVQSGLGLPDRDYYLKDDERFKNIRSEFVKHMSVMLGYLNYPDAQKYANSILEMETRLAEASMSRVDMRDEEKTYNIHTFSSFKALTPGIPWDVYFKTTGAGTQYRLSVNHVDFYKRLNEVFTSVPLETWKAYLTFNVISTTAGNLSRKYVNEDFNFYSRILNGVEVQKPRWKTALNATDASIGEIVGKVYVDKYFTASSKQRIENLVKNLRAAFKNRIEQLDWMSTATKAKAQEKLSLFNAKFAYPDKWKDYSSLEIKPGEYVLNMIRANEFEYKRMISKLGKEVDRSEWLMLPHQVNAYYEPTLNEIVFPAGIMQPPFFYPEADDAVNYGAIGAVIGHEITHGFDDQGSKYDGKGNLNDWWTEEDRKKFDEKAAKLVDQFNSYEALPGVFVNGELTLGENIADLGGLSTSYQAYQLSLNGKAGPLVGGFTAEQRFFLAFAQVWRGNFKDEYLRKMVMTNVHAPGMFRAKGTVSNMPEFYKAFTVKSGDQMYRDDYVRAKIW